MPITSLLSQLSILIPALLTIPMILMAFVVNKHYVNHSKIRKEGIVSIGKVTDFWIAGSVNQNGRNLTSIEYEYSIDNQLFKGNVKTFSISDTNQLMRGNSIQIKYIANQSTATEYEVKEDLNPYFFPLIPLFFFILLFPFKSFMSTEYSKYKRLLQNGILKPGIIESSGNASIFSTDSFINISYSYEHNGSRKTDDVFIGKEDFINLKPGEEVNVLVSEDGLSCVVTKEFLWYLDK